MPNYAAAYGAGGGVDALRQVLTDRITTQKIAEDNRRAQVAEAADAARLAQQGDQFRAQLAARQGEFMAGRDEHYQDRLADVRRQDIATQEHQTEREIGRKEHFDDVAARAADRDKTLAAAAGEGDKNRALQRYIAGMRAGPDAEGRDLAHQLTQLRIDAERGKQDAAATAKTQAESAKNAERSGLISLAMAVRDHPDMAANVGAWDANMPTFRAGSHDFQSKKDQLIAMLSLEGRAKLKGSGAISDFEAKMLERAGTSLNPAAGEKAFRGELDRLIGGLGPKVTLIAPDGSRQEVPAADADHYLSQGAKVAP